MSSNYTSSSSIIFPAIFLVGIVIFLVSGLAIYEARELADFSDKINKHPLVVSNAVRKIQADINAIHRSMKDVVIAKNPGELKKSIERVDTYEKESFKDFKLIAERFLGDPKYVESALRDFKNWKPIRSKVIALKEKGEDEKASTITKTEGPCHIVLINEGKDGKSGLNYILEFAEIKALEFSASSKQKNTRTIIEIFLVFVLSIVLIVIAVFLFRRSMKATDKLQKSEEQYRSLARELELEKEQWLVTLRSIGDGVIVTDTGGKVKLINPVAEHLTGWSQDDAYGVSIDKVFHIINEKSRKPLESPIQKALKHNRVFGLENSTILVSKDGTEIIIADSGAPIHDMNDNILGAVLVFRDETKKTEDERHLRQVQKMEAIGTLAGGIAHDFNNILAAILGYSELVQDNIHADNPSQGYLNEILKATTRAKDLVKQILAFSRKNQDERKPIQLSSIVKEAIKLLRSTIPTTIEITQKIDNSTGLVNADPTQMHQIVMNLCTNAAHAMWETGGVLKISLCPVVIEKESMSNYNELPFGPYLELIISDMGTGIDSRIIHRIFEPFFTTKKDGKGTGMGLAVVHGIVKDHNGDITVESQLDKGTTFTILFPQVIADIDKAEDTPSKIPTGNEHILFVDDEKTLMALGKKILESLGYKVTAQNSSLEALNTFKQTPDIFDMVITDQTMPHMTGYNLAKKILEIKPLTPVIICTGYSDTVSLEKTEEAGIKELIFKPIRKKEIAQKIRNVLDKNGD